MYKSVIIEDELNARALLKSFLEKYCDITVSGEAENVEDGIQVIHDEKPDIVLLDISLPDYNGFELLRRLQPVTFEVIFVTAYDEFAIQAIKMSAVDYLLKPVDIGELRIAVERAKERVKSHKANQNLLVLLENLSQPPVSKKIAIPDGHGFAYEDVSNIIRLRAQGRYTEIFTISGKKYTVTKNLGEFDKLLAQYSFLRVHHSHLVNPVHIASFEKSDGGFLKMDDKSYVEVSRKNKEELMIFLKKV